MKLSFWSENNYGKIIGKALSKRGYEIEFDKITKETDITFLFGAMTPFRFWNMQYNRRNMYKTKITYIVFDIPEWRLETTKFKRFYNEYKQMLTLADYVFTISQTVTNDLKRLWNIDSKPLFHVFDNETIENQLSDNIKKNPGQIVAIGHMKCHKRFDILICALRDSKFKLKIISNGGEEEKKIIELAKNLNVDLQILKNVGDPEKLLIMQESEFCVHPSEFEGLSIVPKEALWCNTVPIISDIPVHLEMHGNTLPTFKTNDANDLRRVLLEGEIDFDIAKNKIQKCTVQAVTDDVEKWLKSL